MLEESFKNVFLAAMPQVATGKNWKQAQIALIPSSSSRDF